MKVSNTVRAVCGASAVFLTFTFAALGWSHTAWAQAVLPVLYYFVTGLTVAAAVWCIYSLVHTAVTGEF
jgi:hypothetical protein